MSVGEGSGPGPGEDPPGGGKSGVGTARGRQRESPMPHLRPSWPPLPCGLAFSGGTGLDESGLVPGPGGWSWALSIPRPAPRLSQGAEPPRGCRGPAGRGGACPRPAWVWPGLPSLMDLRVPRRPVPSSRGRPNEGTGQTNHLRLSGVQKRGLLSRRRGFNKLCTWHRLPPRFLPRIARYSHRDGAQRGPYTGRRESAVMGGQLRKRKPNLLSAVLCTDSATMGQPRSTRFRHTWGGGA